MKIRNIKHFIMMMFISEISWILQFMLLNVYGFHMDVFFFLLNIDYWIVHNFGSLFFYYQKLNCDIVWFISKLCNLLNI